MQSAQKKSSLEKKFMPLSKTGNFGKFWVFIILFCKKKKANIFIYENGKSKKRRRDWKLVICFSIANASAVVILQQENSWIFLFCRICGKHVYVLKSFRLFLQFSFLAASDNCVDNLRIWSLNRTRHLTKLTITFITKAAINLSNAEKYWNISSFEIF